MKNHYFELRAFRILSRNSCFCSSVYSLLDLNGFLPNRKGYRGQRLTVQDLTSFELPHEQSKHLSLIALIGLVTVFCSSFANSGTNSGRFLFSE